MSPGSSGSAGVLKVEEQVDGAVAVHVLKVALPVRLGAVALAHVLGIAEADARLIDAGRVETRGGEDRDRDHALRAQVDRVGGTARLDVDERLIDIKPGSATNPINLRAKGVIPIAILSTASFDATSVDPASVCFGDAEDVSQRDCTEAHGKGHLEDVNGDGRLDLLLHFETQQTGIDPGDTQACLSGKTFAGVSVEGCDAITTL